MQSTGYSGTPLAKKLGIKEGFIMRLIYEPSNYFTLFTDMPQDVNFTNDKKILKNCIHYFTKELKDLDKEMSGLRNEILPDGMIWISWPKKSSKLKTNITENDIRNIALANGLVDIKVCAIDETWSGLKLVIPLKDRKNK
ncbi:DUF3052 family protein [Ginsengibacter hankyongi]|uniref:DUF3052 family protein n=1 Tax=Ginsengibacter hankyongi TaxID=2607284 RepID=A0A5J5ICA0_9BACT|nr:DUF3052 family protein [Ginsengibacter hankyongi]KAA9034627.1 DUF3052 family protein [Ginsengibacter hankyongi]